MRWMDFFIFVFSLLAIMIIDTAFRKSRLGKLILEKIIPGTSENWPYHIDLLVFYLKFKLPSVCEYLHYYHNITNDCWAVPEKSKQGGLRTYFFKKKTWIFEVCHSILGNSGQNKAFSTLGSSVKLCYTLWKFHRQKPRLMKMQHDFFLITRGNSGQIKALPLEIL